MTELKRLMDELSSLEGILGSGIISKDGKAVEMRMPEKLNLETISIMAATVYGAACTLHTEADRSRPDRVTIRTEGYTTHIFDIGKRTLATVITSEDCDPDDLYPIVESLSREFDST
jgi:predicted regulator of Ras-like GTPase activity (Roadblock/LC7/MglB family)